MFSPDMIEFPAVASCPDASSHSHPQCVAPFPNEAQMSIYTNLHKT